MRITELITSLKFIYFLFNNSVSETMQGVQKFKHTDSIAQYLDEH